MLIVRLPIGPTRKLPIELTSCIKPKPAALAEVGNDSICMAVSGTQAVVWAQNTIVSHIVTHHRWYAGSRMATHESTDAHRPSCRVRRGPIHSISLTDITIIAPLVTCTTSHPRLIRPPSPSVPSKSSYILNSSNTPLSALMRLPRWWWWSGCICCCTSRMGTCLADGTAGRPPGNMSWGNRVPLKSAQGSVADVSLTTMLPLMKGSSEAPTRASEATEGRASLASPSTSSAAILPALSAFSCPM
mmetsp:Transcript_33410/g.96522  ORF Transcript_33410/g.96522 Transcript_33410/m.96522 type:complete len:245 (+) Transcript_33410:520-1254(+)